jgi:hypothetical protein
MLHRYRLENIPSVGPFTTSLPLSAILGYVSDGEAEGKRFYWAEWPLPGSEETTPEVEELKLAA